MNIALVYRKSESFGRFHERIALYKKTLKALMRDFFLEHFDRQQFGKFCPDKVIFFQPFSPDAAKLLEYMIEDSQKMLDIIFEFSLRFDLKISSLTKLELILMKARVRFICEGNNQKKLLENWIQGTHIVHSREFPIGNEFFYDPSLRDKGRRRWGIPKKATVFCYSGTLSRQKNILALLETFHHFKKMQKDAFLLLSGHFQDEGNPFLGDSSYSFGQYYDECQCFLKREDIDGIVFLEKFKDNTLNELYNTSDYYISLSCDPIGEYSTEAKQALCAGTPCRIPDWSGYRDIKGLLGVQCFPVSFKKSQIVVEREQFFKQLFLDQVKRTKDREPSALIARVARETLAVHKNNLFSIVEKQGIRFSGFKKNFFNYHRLYKKKPQTPFLKTGTTDRYTKYYETIYRDFFSSPKRSR